MNGREERAAAAICHIEIPAVDLARAKRFYELAFAWTVRENDPGRDYWFFEAGNLVGALDASRVPAEASQGVCLILRVDDVAATLARIEDAGGRRRGGIRRLPDHMGFVATFEDPNGVTMQLWADDPGRDGG